MTTLLEDLKAAQDALTKWKQAAAQVEECELNEYAHYAIQMLDFLDTDEARDDELFNRLLTHIERLEKAEPAAWRYLDTRGTYRYAKGRKGWEKEYQRLKPEPLYTHPAPSIPESWKLVPFPDLNEGEKAVGAIISADGSRREWLILLPGESEAANWKSQMEWAASIGGELPDRVESALLFNLMKDDFKREAYWTREQYVENSEYAWCQDFFNGTQYLHYGTSNLRARAVRRVYIKE